MSPLDNLKTPKAPRWITTEAGQVAWFVDEDWRRTADRALSVSERQRLLEQAERIRLSYEQNVTQ
jgi:RNA polymerase-interacting CarD/CdnL/TRCF family regulator